MDICELCANEAQEVSDTLSDEDMPYQDRFAMRSFFQWILITLSLYYLVDKKEESLIDDVLSEIKCYADGDCVPVNINMEVYALYKEGVNQENLNVDFKIDHLMGDRYHEICPTIRYKTFTLPAMRDAILNLFEQINWIIDKK